MAQYRVAKKFYIGGKSDLTIEEDSVVGFDGSTLTYAGKDYDVPQLRSAIEKGWLEEVSTKKGKAVAKAPAPQAAPTSKYATHSQSSEVKKVADHTAKRHAAMQALADKEIKKASTIKAPTLQTEDKKYKVVSPEEQAQSVAKIRFSGGDQPPVVEWEQQPKPKRAFAGEVDLVPTKQRGKMRVEVQDDGESRPLVLPVRNDEYEDYSLTSGEQPEKLKTSLKTTKTAKAEPAKPKKKLSDRAAGIVAAWDTKQTHYQIRVKEAIENYAKDPEVMEAIAQIESGGVAKRLRDFVAKQKLGL